MARPTKSTDTSFYDLARVVRDGVECSAEPAEIRRLILDSARPFAERAGASGVEFVCDVSTFLPRMLVVDPWHLEQVLAALFEYAVNSTAHGEIFLEVQLLPEPPPESLEIGIRFTLTDTSDGMTEEERSAVAAPLVMGEVLGAQLSPSAQRVRFASGLLRLLDVQLTVDSAPGVGTMFTFDLEVPRALEQTDEKIRALPVGMEMLFVPSSWAVADVVQRAILPLGGRVDFCRDMGGALARTECAAGAARRWPIVIDIPASDVGGLYLKEIESLIQAPLESAILLLAPPGRGYSALTVNDSRLIILEKPFTHVELHAALAKARRSLRRDEGIDLR